jgi:hypothetical protein
MNKINFVKKSIKRKHETTKPRVSFAEDRNEESQEEWAPGLRDIGSNIPEMRPQSKFL